ncbi:MAG: CAP domain-containing protein [Pseudomonadota bacterium]|nr:CAP domain-containing protein [Pseudomonadota bacterium]
MKKLTLIILFMLLFIVPPVFAGGREYADTSIYLWQLINEARARPLATIQSLGIDEEAARRALGADAALLDGGLPPLAWDNHLAMAATGHSLDMVEKLYYSSTGPDGSLPEDRVAAAGYRGAAVGEPLGAMAFSAFIEPEEAARLVFASWVRDELDPGRTAKRYLFSREMSEVGFVGAVLSLGEGIPTNVYVAVADFAAPLVPRFFIMGTVYEDIDGNGRLSAGESRSGVSFSCRVDGYPGVYDGKSGIAGVYQLPLVDGDYIIRLADEQGGATVVYRRNALGVEENCLLDLRLR